MIGLSLGPAEPLSRAARSEQLLTDPQCLTSRANKRGGSREAAKMNESDEEEEREEREGGRTEGRSEKMRGEREGGVRGK